MKVLLTGASGFIGRHLMTAFLERGHRVVALSRSGASPHPEVHAVEGDVASGEGLELAAAGADAVVHLVGIIHEAGPSATFEKVHIRGTANMLAAAESVGVRRFVHMSALGVEHPAGSGYMTSKARAEELVARSGLDWTVFRPSLVFGVGDAFFGDTLAKLVKLPPIIPLIGHGRFPMRPVWVGDVALAFTQALERPATIGRRYTLVGPQEYRFRDLLELVRDALGLRKPIVSVPLPLMRLVIPMLALLPSPPITRDQLTMLVQGNTGDPAEALAAFDLAMEPLPMHLPAILGIAPHPASRPGA